MTIIQRSWDEITRKYTIHKEGYLTNNRFGRRIKEHGDNYKIVGLCLFGKVSGIKIHRLIAKMHVPNPNNYPCVNHIDGNKRNNRADNLEWCTTKMNQNHAVKLGLIRSGDKNPMTSIPDKTVRLIHKLRSIGADTKTISKMFGVRRHYVSAILRGQSRPLIYEQFLAESAQR